MKAKHIGLLLLLFIFFSCKEDISIDCYNSLSVINPNKIKKKALIIGIDGFRSDAMQQYISPFMYNLSKSNNVYYTPSHSVENSTWSGSNWASLLTGVHYNKHNVIMNNFDINNFKEFPSFFHYIENAASYLNTVSIDSWTKLYDFTLYPYVDFAISYNRGKDSTIFNKSKEILLNSNPLKPDILFLHFYDLDSIGHTHGFDPLLKEYRNTLNKVDYYIEYLFSIIENKRSNGEDWIIFIVSDHGGYEKSHSDSNNPHINNTIFFVQHPNLKFNKNHITNQSDLAPTILDFIGIFDPEFECKKDGISILK